MKLFRTSNVDIKYRRDVFGIKLPSVQLIQRFIIVIQVQECRGAGGFRLRLSDAR